MRTFIAIVVCLLCSTVAHGQSMVGEEVEFPYEAFVLRDEAPVRSGPGVVHYATDKLAQGATVEVYRHDPGGWCAIRPPSESFSLVPESVVEIIEDNVGRIASGSAQAWVGTRLGVVENPLWQVKLKEDELIEILGEVSWPNPEGHSTIWYQIAPPSGEFRWIQISDLQLPDRSTQINKLGLQNRSNVAQNDSRLNNIPSPAPLVIANPLPSTPAGVTAGTAFANSASPGIQAAQTTMAPSVNSQNIRPGANRHAALAHTNQQPADSIPDSPIKSVNDGWRRSKSPLERDSGIGKHVSSQPPNQFTAPAIPTNGFDSSTNSVAGYNSPAAQQPSFGQAAQPVIQNQQRPERFASTADPWGIAPLGSSPPSTHGPAGPINNDLQQLELALTNEMLKPQPADWQLDDLLIQAEQFVDHANIPSETHQCNRLIEKIKRCQQIRSRYRTTFNSSMSNSGPSKSIRGPIGTGVSPEVELGTTYDAYGWLNELVRGKGSVDSSYVLEDDQGKITHHLLPAPGVNLHRYIGSKVGVMGQRGFNQRLNLNHVTVQRVVELRKAR